MAEAAVQEKQKTAECESQIMGERAHAPGSVVISAACR
jgi:hypothetical protein